MLTKEEFKKLPLVIQKTRIHRTVDEILEFLAENPGVDVKEFAEFLGIKPNSALMKAKRLQREGLVELRYDKKKYYIGLR